MNYEYIKRETTDTVPVEQRSKAHSIKFRMPHRADTVRCWPKSYYPWPTPALPSD